MSADAILRYDVYKLLNVYEHLPHKGNNKITNLYNFTTQKKRPTNARRFKYKGI